MTLRLILNADDFGYDPAVTLGIEQSMRRGVVSSTTMMVNSPHSAHAAERADGLSIGLHLNVVRFQSLSDPSREFNERDPLSPEFVARETEAQLEKLKQLLGRPATHIDVHKHAHLRPEVLQGVCHVAARVGLPVRSITQAMRDAIRAMGARTNDEFRGEADVHAYWTAPRWLAELDTLPMHGTVEFMCHPGLRPSHLKSGYAEQREIELATFTEDAAQAALSLRRLALCSWADT
jgi:predicted glycoside hydrolase/deacetylase ChbG (UPF0249 family)